LVVNFLHLLDQFGQNSEVGDLIDRRNLEVVENLIELRLRDLRRDRAHLRQTANVALHPLQHLHLQVLIWNVARRPELGDRSEDVGVESLTNVPTATLDPTRYACINRSFL
jgi:hypothetical protein